MLTTSHGIIGYLLYQNKGKKEWKLAIAGAVISDISFFMSSTYLAFLGFISSNSAEYETLHQQVHNSWFDLMFTPIFHSVWLWIFLIVLAFTFKKKWLAFGGGGMSHVITDFLTHQGRWTWNHLFPLDFEPIEGIFNYTDTEFFMVIHGIWVIIFLPRIYKFVKKKYAKTA